MLRDVVPCWFRSCWRASCVESEDTWRGAVRSHYVSTVIGRVTQFATVIVDAYATRFVDDVECAATFRRLASFVLLSNI